MCLPSTDEIRRGYLAYQEHDKRDAMYKVTSFLVDYFWGSPADMADAIGVLLLTWSQAFYRFGPFDFDALEGCLSENRDTLDKYRHRSILDFSFADVDEIRELFQHVLVAQAICEGRKQGVQSPVAAAKTLHILAPNFFPIWDNRIAHAYQCDYASQPLDRYIDFMEQMKQIAERLQTVQQSLPTNKTLLKLIDEYNYARYTKDWV